MMFIKKFILLAICFYTANALAWDGYNYTTGEYFSITIYDHQGIGEGYVEICDIGYINCRDGYLDLYPDLTGVLTDYETGEDYDIEMESK